MIVTGFLSKFLYSCLELISDTPYGGYAPGGMILDFFTQPFDVNVYCPGIADVLIAPDLVQELLPGENMVGR